MYVCTVEVFKTRQHLRSLAPVLNDDDNDGQMIFGDLGGLKCPDICLAGEEEPRKNLSQETCPERGRNPGPLRDRRACYMVDRLFGIVVSTSIIQEVPDLIPDFRLLIFFRNMGSGKGFTRPREDNLIAT